MSVTFEVDEVERSTKPIIRYKDGNVHGEEAADLTAEQSLSALLDTKGQPVPVEALGTNKPAHRKFLWGTHHPLIESGLAAYSGHYPLELSPDTIWLTLAQGFAIHVNENAERLRGRFVRHQGKEIIRVRRDEFVKGDPNNDWPGCFSEFSDQIAKHIGKQRDLVVSDFSTTGPIEKAASEIVLMDAMRSYFDYRVMTLCGIPEVTLLGTIDDWKDIRTRAHVFAEYELDWWIKELVPVLDQFVNAMAGNADPAFWGSFCKTPGGSGGTRINGWINRLFPYLNEERGKYTRNSAITAPLPKPEQKKSAQSWRGGHDGPQAYNFPLGLSKASFLWEYHTQETPMEFIAGLVGSSQDQKGRFAISPVIGWAVREGK